MLTISATDWQSLNIQSEASASVGAARTTNGDPSSETICDNTTNEKGF